MLDRRVYLKTLSGLKPVDVILRRLDDSFCDPLELRGDSLLGVPGLVEAVRSGSVVIDNALGSGLVETSANMAFLPGLCRQLLGEELRMPSVATWWCGQEDAPPLCSGTSQGAGDQAGISTLRTARGVSRIDESRGLRKSGAQD